MVMLGAARPRYTFFLKMDAWDCCDMRRKNYENREQHVGIVVDLGKDR